MPIHKKNQPYVVLVSRPRAVVRFRARGVFIFVRNFSRGIFLRESLSKVVEVLNAIHFVAL
jgi:hypothetical protein